MASTKQARNTIEARAASKARNTKRDAEALALAADDSDADDSDAEHGSQWATERTRIAQGSGKGSRFVALAAALADCYTKPGAAVSFDAVAAATAAHMPNGKPLQRSTVGSWRTLLQRAKQTGVDVCGARIADDGAGFVYPAAE